LSYADTYSRGRIRTCISRSSGEVPLIFTTGRTWGKRHRG